jgi:DNA-directed RNA polymerase subunit RPC12/RpoP
MRASLRKHIVKPFWLSVALFAVVGLWRYFDGVWQGAPKSVSPFDITWTTSVAIAIATGTVILAMFSVFTPTAFNRISQLLGWAEKQESSVSEPNLPSVLNAGSPLKCPKCGHTDNFRQGGLVDLTGAGGSVKIAGRDFGFFAKKQAESVRCDYCGYTFYRRISV